MPDRNVIADLLPHLSASEWRTPPEVAERSRWSVQNVRRALTIAADARIVERQYKQRPGYRVMDPQPTYRLRERERSA
jgi:hypothetical protein